MPPLAFVLYAKYDGESKLPRNVYRILFCFALDLRFEPSPPPPPLRYRPRNIVLLRLSHTSLHYHITLTTALYQYTEFFLPQYFVGVIRNPWLNDIMAWIYLLTQ